MVNIQNARIVDYGSGKSVTVYFDDVDTKMYYIVPSPRLVMGNGRAPHFSLTKYVKNDGKVAGLCTFDVELAVPDDAKKAVADALPADNYPGQLNYLSVDSYFFYDIDGEVRVAPGTGSMYGSNRVSYAIELKTDAEIKSFVNAFTHGSLSPFRVEYDAIVLTRLPEVDVTVTYDPQIAITYETQYVNQKNIWGQNKQVASGVKQYLKDSGAGDVKVRWSVTPGDETRQRVYDWGFTTLEKLVSDALTTALQQSGGSSPVSYVGHIIRNYSEKEVVGWNFVTSDPLPAFDQFIWPELYKEVDTQQLAVKFSLLGELTKAEDGGAIIQQVKVTIDYPTKVTGNTITLAPQGTSSITYTAPGQLTGSVFNNKYKYQYQVFFVNDPNPYKSEWVESTLTDVEILPNQLGIRQTTFVGSNVPFTPAPPPQTPMSITVDKLMIDFFFQRPAGEPNKVQSEVMTSNGETGKKQFSSLFHLPLTNTYTYRLTYQMSDGTTFLMEPTDQFGPANKDMILLISPFREASFMFRAQVPMAPGSPGTDPTIQDVFIDARYLDPINKADLNENFQWVPPASSTSGMASSTPWKYRAVYNPNGAYYSFNGLITYSDGDFNVSDLNMQANQSQLTLSAKTEPYSVQINANYVDWKVVDQVDLTVFQTESGPPPPPEQLLRPRTAMDLVKEKTINLRRFPLLKPKTAAAAEETRYYLLQRPRDAMNVTFSYGAEYIHADGTKKFIPDIEVTDQLVLTLPPDGKDKTPVIHQRVLKFGAKKAQMA